MADEATLAAYDSAAASFADDWHGQPPPSDLHAVVDRFFRPGTSVADIGCGSGREVGWLAARGYVAQGFDASRGLLAEARRRYPTLTFAHADLPALDGIAPASFDSVLCETVIMHLDRGRIAAAVRRLIDIVRPGGVLYLSWRVTKGADQRDGHGRLYAAFDAAEVRCGLDGARLLLDEEVVSASSGKVIHRIVAEKRGNAD
ncbi:bifunctional 2-polyprenyl-6-hydroxyphenol methylase/3-demethylubiquinol 3-O-methyltransferase UbiG [Bradyrhizobium sp. WD16]|uniref:class I SAM-dependent methyltransferase n=1 Tax=Bradyrhizobium sp. WD16 TaxID=1521768 RepID=UPI0020A2E2C1|nr:class I SAM-dependent methyltransferase [Bradyrhizobium sp. WD16]UTD25818.1 SAM-dependent methyltransferase [Bradyrhizobium sp. WD16]